MRPSRTARLTCSSARRITRAGDPEQLLEGWLLKSGFDPYEEVRRVRLYLRVVGDNPNSNEAFIQVIPKNPDPNGPIRYTEDA